MTGELALATIAAVGGMGGLVAFFQYLNTRKSTKDKSATDSYSSYRAFISGATDDRDRELSRMKAEREVLWTVRSTLVDILQDMITYFRKFGIHSEQIDRFQDRLDAARRI